MAAARKRWCVWSKGRLVTCAATKFKAEIYADTFRRHTGKSTVVKRASKAKR